MLRSINFTVSLMLVGCGLSLPHQASVAPKPTEHILGSITAIQADTQTVSVREDKSSQMYIVSLANTRTLLKVVPGAKDLQQATRIVAGDLAVGDRVDVRGFPGEAASEIQARSLVLMSGRDLAAKHESEAQEWRDSSVGQVVAVNAGSQSIQADLRTPQGTKSTAIQMAPSTAFLRYDPKAPRMPLPSTLSVIQPGDQIHIIGTTAGDGSSMTATKIYSAPVRTVAGTITSSTPTAITLKDPQTQKIIVVSITETTVVRKVPAEMADALKARTGTSGGPAAQNGAQRQGSGPGGLGHQDGTTTVAPTMPRPHANLSRMLDRLPIEATSDLKAGDAIIVSGFAGEKPGDIVASTIVSGVEALLQAPSRQSGRPVSTDWGLDAPMPQ